VEGGGSRGAATVQYCAYIDLFDYSHKHAGFLHRKLSILWLKVPRGTARTGMYSSAPVSTGNTFQDLPWLRETADNTERYTVYNVIFV
jgi:hypothetical protein